MRLRGRKFMQCIAADPAALADPTIAFADVLKAKQ
jgi:hypothetical protein